MYIIILNLITAIAFAKYLIVSIWAKPSAQKINHKFEHYNYISVFQYVCGFENVVFSFISNFNYDDSNAIVIFVTFVFSIITRR